jgi:hypothetical protein
MILWLVLDNLTLDGELLKPREKEINLFQPVALTLPRRDVIKTCAHVLITFGDCIPFFLSAHVFARLMKHSLRQERDQN